MELMGIVSKLNETIPTDGSMELAPSRDEVLFPLEQRLRSLRQILTPPGLIFPITGNESSVLDTAELYRIAALIFLERAVGEDLDTLRKSST